MFLESKPPVAWTGDRSTAAGSTFANSNRQVCERTHMRRKSFHADLSRSMHMPARSIDKERIAVFSFANKTVHLIVSKDSTFGTRTEMTCISKMEGPSLPLSLVFCAPYYPLRRPHLLSTVPRKILNRVSPTSVISDGENRSPGYRHICLQ